MNYFIIVGFGKKTNQLGQPWFSAKAMGRTMLQKYLNLLENFGVQEIQAIIRSLGSLQKFIVVHIYEVYV